MNAICTYRQTSSLYFIASNFTWFLQAITAVTKILKKKTASFEACYCSRAAFWLETRNKANLLMQITHWLRHYNCKILWLGECQGVTVTSAIHWHRLPSIIPTIIVHSLCPLSNSTEMCCCFFSVINTMLWFSEYSVTLSLPALYSLTLLFVQRCLPKTHQKAS